MVKTHLAYILFKMSRERFDEYQFVDTKVKTPVELLIKIFALKELQKDCLSLYECGYFKPGSSQLVDACYK